MKSPPVHHGRRERRAIWWVSVEGGTLQRKTALCSIVLNPRAAQSLRLLLHTHLPGTPPMFSTVIVMFPGDTRPGSLACSNSGSGWSLVVFSSLPSSLSSLSSSSSSSLAIRGKWEGCSSRARLPLESRDPVWGSMEEKERED